MRDERAARDNMTLSTSWWEYSCIRSRKSRRGAIASGWNHSLRYGESVVGNGVLLVKCSKWQYDGTVQDIDYFFPQCSDVVLGAS